MKRPPKPIEALMYAGIRSAITCVTAGDIAARLHFAKSLGRWFGGAKFNRKRLARASENLKVAFPEWSQDKRDQHAIASYEHILQLGIELAYTPRVINHEAWSDRVEVGGVAPALRQMLGSRPCIFVTGHCGNWELSAYTVALLGVPVHAIYRPLDLKPLDAWLRRVRGQRGMVLLDKFGAMKQLPELMEKRYPPGFVADQNAGERGSFVPFFGRLASTYKAIALLALRYDAVILTGGAVRLGGETIPGTNVERQPWPMRYSLYFTDAFGPEVYRAQPDPAFYITARYRRAIEQCVRMAPEQYLWMHRFWKSRPHHERAGKPFPARLEAKLRDLPWMTDDEMARIKDHSARDSAEYLSDPRNTRRGQGEVSESEDGDL